MLYAIIARDIPASQERRLASRPAHLARLEQLKEEGRLVLAGPHPAIDSNDPGAAGFTGSLIVAEFDSLAAAQSWAEAVGGARGIAGRVGLAVGPGRLELAAGTRALLVDGAANAATDLAEQPDAARRLVLGTAHGDHLRADADGQFVGYDAACGTALAPIERHTKMRTAGAAGKTRIVSRHGWQNTRETGERRRAKRDSSDFAAAVKRGAAADLLSADGW
ncbi:hypothetical protein Z046_10040 [Pseudomonas aeruginosa VRFPA09]|nr:hypothetical protein Z046_10040 [Pseudomonas aeruginosa VRFPA09]